MVQHYEPIYSYQPPRTAASRTQPLLRLVALLTFVAVSSVAFLSFTNHVYWRQSQPRTHSTPPSSALSFSIAQPLSNMTSNAPTLGEYLLQAKQDAFAHLQPGSAPISERKLTLIMGNEAGDLDSAACAIALSYLLTRFGPPSNYHLNASAYVPLIQSSHTDDVLRPENTAAFRAAGVVPDQLFYLDDVQESLGLELDSAAFAPSANVAIGLVDHPSLTGPWGGARASNRQVEIVIDHHEDVGDHADAALRIVKSPSKEPVGSCSSLIAELFAEQFAKSSASDIGLRQVADLLISAIIIDTDNLRSAPRGKATKADFEAVKILFPSSSFGNPYTSDKIREAAFSFSPLRHTTQESGTGIEPIQPISPSEETDSSTQSAKIILAPYWQILSRSKQAVSHLSGRDLLRRDYKELDFTSPENADPAHADLALKLGFASVPISIVEWLHKDRRTPRLADAADPKQEVKDAWAAWWKVLDEFMAERKIDIAVMTGSFRVPEGEVDAGKHKRELVLAFAPRTMPASQASTLWEELRKGLESDAHVAADQVDRRLMLEEPWKGQRLPESAGGKRERVKGVDIDGKRKEIGDAGAAADKPRWAKVYRQANARANRKIVLPAVTTILKAAARKL